MKKIIKILALVMTLALIFCSCGKTETDAEAKNEEPGTQTASESGSSDESFSPSLYHDDNGMWEGITASEFLTMGEYKGISISGVEPEESEILSEIDALLESYATNVPVFDRAIVQGDSVNIDYVGYVDGVAFEGGDTQGKGTDVTAGSTAYIDDFLTQIIGHMPGDEFDVNVTFPEDYGKEELNGKDAVFKTKINFINEPTTPEFTDDEVEFYLSEEYGVKTCDELYDFVKNALRDNRITSEVDNILSENFTVNDIPEKMMDYQKKSMEDYYIQYASYYGVDLDTFLTTYVGVSSMDEMLSEYEEDMKDSCGLSLIIQAIAEKEGLTVSEDEAMEFLKEVTGQEDTSSYINAYGVNYFKMVALQEKVYDLIKENAVIE